MKKKLSFVPVLAVAFALLMSSISFAKEVSFTKKFVDSNSYTFITSAVKDTYSETADIKISNIYKADGSSSNYNIVWIKVSGVDEGVPITKGYWYTMDLPPLYKDAGDSIILYAKGNNARLDCMISGILDVH